jgi:hypothetical protein
MMISLLLVNCGSTYLANRKKRNLAISVTFRR